MKLAIISEKTRYHFQQPLKYFKKIDIYHFYKKTYSDSLLKSKKLIKYKNIFDLYLKLKKLKPNLVQGLEPYYGYSRIKIPLKIVLVLITTFIYCKLNKIPYFFHVLENIPPERKYGFFAGKIMQFLAKIYAKNACFIYYLNNRAKENMKKLQINEKKLDYYLYGIWGVDINKFRPHKKVEKRLIFIGSLNEQKGIINLINAINILKNRICDIKLIIIGAGEKEQEVRKLIYQNKLNNNIILKGEIKANQIASQLKNSYMLILPAKELKYSAEQVGVVFLEASACGVPIIATDSGSINEYVIRSKTGLLIKNNRPKTIINAIIKLWKDGKLHDKLSRYARNYTLENFNARKNITKIEKDILKKITRINHNGK